MGTNKKQTAVSWLEDKLFNRPIRPLFVSISVTELSQLLNQAKQMEREQTGEDYNAGYKSGVSDFGSIECGKELDSLSSEQYYKQTYGTTN